MHDSLVFACVVLLQLAALHLCQHPPLQLTPVVLQTCKDTFSAPLYILGDSLSGLVIQVYIPSELCDQPATVYAVHAANWLVITCIVQVCVMDSRAYASLTPGMETAEELDACTLLVNSQACTMCKQCSHLAHTTYLSYFIMRLSCTTEHTVHIIL